MTDECTATASVQVDNEQVRVTKWDFPPGTQTGLHSHEYDYIVVPISAGTLTVHTAEGNFDNVLTPGMTYQRAAKTTHNVVNETEAPCSFVEIELKPGP